MFQKDIDKAYGSKNKTIYFFEIHSKLINLPNGVIKGQETLYIVINEKFSNVQAYWTPKLNSRSNLRRTPGTSALDLLQLELRKVNQKFQ